MEWGLGREQSKGKERRVRLNHTPSVPLLDLDHQIARTDIDYAVPRARVAKLKDSYVENNGRTSVFLKFQNEQEVDVKNTPAVSLPKKNHDSVMNCIDMEFLPLGLPPFYPFEKVSVEPMVPFKVTTSIHPSKSLNASSTKVHYCVASAVYN